MQVGLGGFELGFGDTQLGPCVVDLRLGHHSSLEERRGPVGGGARVLETGPRLGHACLRRGDRRCRGVSRLNGLRQTNLRLTDRQFEWTAVELEQRLVLIDDRVVLDEDFGHLPGDPRGNLRNIGRHRASRRIGREPVRDRIPTDEHRQDNHEQRRDFLCGVSSISGQRLRIGSSFVLEGDGSRFRLRLTCILPGDQWCRRRVFNVTGIVSRLWGPLGCHAEQSIWRCGQVGIICAVK